MNKTVLITGATSGIGLGCARKFAENGDRLILTGRNEKRLEEIRRELEEMGTKVLVLTFDVRDSQKAKQQIDNLPEEWKEIDVLVNNAGIDTQPSAPPEVSGPFEDFPEEVFREVVDTNLVGTFLMCQAVGKRMVKAGKGGSIINVGSIYGMLSPIQDIYAYKKEQTGVPFIKPVAYSAAKSGIYNLTRYLATYWGEKGIRVNTLTPAGVWRDTQDATFIHNFTERMPMKRMSHENEYNGAVIFLASKASSFMTGSNLVIDGGWTAW